MICFLKGETKAGLYLGFLNFWQAPEPFTVVHLVQKTTKPAPKYVDAEDHQDLRTEIERDDGAMTSGYIPHQVIFPIVVDPFFCGEIYRFAT